MANACPVCEQTDVEIYLEGGSETIDPSMIGSSRKAISPGRILRCRSCAFAFRQTRFNVQSLAELYRNMDPQIYQAELAGRVKTALRNLRIVKRHERGGQILDVGCASGFFLSLAAGSGFEPTGIEPSDILRDEAQKTLGCRGQVFGATLEQVSLPPAHFDAVTLWDVLEHVPDPLAMLKKCGDLLRPGGHLFLNVPDLDSIEARVLGRRWPLLLAEHLNYFNRRSLRLCGAKAGLTLVRFGRRRAFFSAQYVFYRLSQHLIPGAGLMYRLARSCAGRWLLPVSLGETYAVWQRTPS